MIRGQDLIGGGKIMKEVFSTIIYAVVFFVLSLATAGVLFLFALPFSMILLAGLIVWAAAEGIRLLTPASWTESASMASVRSNKVVHGHGLDLRAHLVGLPAQRVTGEHRLHFAPHARKSRKMGRIAALSMRHPHHAHAHSA
jgi:hypothetical protein